MRHRKSLSGYDTTPNKQATAKSEERTRRAVHTLEERTVIAHEAEHEADSSILNGYREDSFQVPEEKIFTLASMHPSLSPNSRHLKRRHRHRHHHALRSSRLLHLTYLLDRLS